MIAHDEQRSIIVTKAQEKQGVQQTKALGFNDRFFILYTRT